MEKWGILGLKRSNNIVLIGNKARGGGVHWRKRPRKMGENGDKSGNQPSPP